MVNLAHVFGVGRVEKFQLQHDFGTLHSIQTGHGVHVKPRASSQTPKVLQLRA